MMLKLILFQKRRRKKKIRVSEKKKAIFEIMNIIWAQLFTSINANLCQVINGGFAINQLSELFPWRKCSIKTLVSYLRREHLYLFLVLFGLMFQCLNRAISSRKLFITSPAKWINTVCDLMEIRQQRSKLLGLFYVIMNLESSDLVYYIG